MAEYVPNLGHVPDSQRRDAIHVAVIPVTLRTAMAPGTHVGVELRDDEYCASQDTKPHIGVIDPFRQENMDANTRAWLFLYPGTARSLHHVWEHPTLDDKLVKARALDIVLNMATDIGCSHLELMETARNNLHGGDEYIRLGHDTPSFSAERWTEFWKAYCALTGEEYVPTHGVQLSCSC